MRRSEDMKNLGEFIMKRNILSFAAFLLVLAGTFSACEKSAFVEEDELYLYAKVENASEYRDVVVVKLMMYRSSIVESEFIELARGDWKEGGFTIVLPKINSNDYRTLINQRWLPSSINLYSSTITISDKNTRAGGVSFWGVDKDGNRVTQFFPHTTGDDDNVGRALFTYVDSDVIISGYIDAGTSCNDYDEYTGATSMWSWRDRTIYSVEMKEGWNVVVHSNFQCVPEGTITEKLSTIPINRLELKWYGGESWCELVID